MFLAKYKGRCPMCDDPIEPGDDVTMVDTQAGRVTIHGPHVQDDEIDPDRAPRTHSTPRTMPRGRTAQDRCSRCFQVPANNGACGCY